MTAYTYKNRYHMKHLLKSFLKKKWESYRKDRLYKHYRDQFKQYCVMQGIANSPVEGEEEYIRKWSVFTPKVEPYSYRLFCRYMGADASIIPENIGHTYVEDILNPIRYQDYYSDKNIFDELFRPATLPITILRRMNGSEILDCNYRIISCLGGLGG